MSKKILIVALGLFSLINLYAKKVDGIIIFNNDSAANVILEVPIISVFNEVNFQSLQKDIKYYNSQGKKIRLKADQVKEIQFKYSYEKIRMISCIDNLKLTRINFFWSRKKILLKLKMDGNLRLYTYYFSNGSFTKMAGTGNGMTSYSNDAERSILQKNKGDLFETHWINFGKDLEEYLSDCPVLVEKIRNKTYKKDDFDKIVWDYNRCKIN